MHVFTCISVPFREGAATVAASEITYMLYWSILPDVADVVAADTASSSHGVIKSKETATAEASALSSVGIRALSSAEKTPSKAHIYIYIYIYIYIHTHIHTWTRRPYRICYSHPAQFALAVFALSPTMSIFSIWEVRLSIKPYTPVFLPGICLVLLSRLHLA